MSPKHVRELEEALPADLTPARLRDVVSLQTVSVLPVERDSIAYVGFILECAWEEEHGLGVLTHLDRVATVGDSDDADTEWVARRDGGRDIVAPPS